MLSVKAALNEVAQSWPQDRASQHETVMCSICHEPTVSWRRRGREQQCLMCVADRPRAENARTRTRQSRSCPRIGLGLVVLISALASADARPAQFVLLSAEAAPRAATASKRPEVPAFLPDHKSSTTQLVVAIATADRRIG